MHVLVYVYRQLCTHQKDKTIFQETDFFVHVHVVRVNASVSICQTLKRSGGQFLNQCEITGARSRLHDDYVSLDGYYFLSWLVPKLVFIPDGPHQAISELILSRMIPALQLGFWACAVQNNECAVWRLFSKSSSKRGKFPCLTLNLSFRRVCTRLLKWTILIDW